MTPHDIDEARARVLEYFAVDLPRHTADAHPLTRELYLRGWAEALRFTAAFVRGAAATPSDFMDCGEMARQIAPYVALSTRLALCNTTVHRLEHEGDELRREIEGLRRELSRRRCVECGGYGSAQAVPDGQAIPCICPRRSSP